MNLSCGVEKALVKIAVLVSLPAQVRPDPCSVSIHFIRDGSKGAEGIFRLFQQLPDLQMLGTLLFAVTAAYAVF